MNKDELKSWIILNDVISYNETQIYVKPTRVRPIQIQLDQFTNKCRSDISERIYWIMNDIDDYPICLTCQNQFKPRFYGHKHGYRNAQCCSIKCTNQSEQHKKSVVDSYFQKTGFYYTNQNPEHKEKLKQISIEKYGVEYVWQSEEIKQKIKNTFLKKYGIENSMHDKEMFEKSQRYRTYKFKLPSGIEINYQGYENVAYRHLLQTYSENEIINGRNNIPKIWYIEDEKKKVYFPDIFFPNENKLIEVKSEWTFKKYYSKNMLKQKASVEAGFNFEFWICDKNTVLDKIIYKPLQEKHNARNYNFKS